MSEEDAVEMTPAGLKKEKDACDVSKVLAVAISLELVCPRKQFIYLAKEMIEAGIPPRRIMIQILTIAHDWYKE